MDTGTFRFDHFHLDPRNRRLTEGGVPVDLNARYLDALTLLVREHGTLVSKDRFLEDVWRGVPVTDEALTQCIRTLRRLLGDDAARPRYIETVPKHGYRFIAAVAQVKDASTVSTAPQAAPKPRSQPAHKWRQCLLLGGAGTLGGGVAGIIGGLFYGFVGASQPLGPGMGAASVLLVLMWLTIAAALTGGFGVGFGIAAAGLATGQPAGTVIGGAVGGCVVGGIVKLLGLDAFNLLLGQSPGDITGAAEGALLGGAVGFGAYLASRRPGHASLRHSIATAGAAGAVAGVLIVLLGGRMMAGSLDLLARSFPASRLRLDTIGSLFGEAGLGPVSQIVTGAMEGALFGGCIVGAMILARKGTAPG